MLLQEACGEHVLHVALGAPVQLTAHSLISGQSGMGPNPGLQAHEKNGDNSVQLALAEQLWQGKISGVSPASTLQGRKHSWMFEQLVPLPEKLRRRKSLEQDNIKRQIMENIPAKNI